MAKSNLIPFFQNGESIPVGNCSNITCVDRTIKHEHVHCEPAPLPVCVNNYPPVSVTDDSGCCSKYDCQCICSGFGDPHYITFDGTYYPFQGNCSYVLVKEIHPKYNFSVVIDNVNCDSSDGLSCPKSLTVYYKAFKIFMSQEISNGIVTNLIYVNNKRVVLPFENSDIRITDNGIESLVVIPAIGAQVTFTGMMFFINLPWKNFHGNTEGQCGTCDNTRTDDCRLPNGTVISSCEKMAPYWHVHDNNGSCESVPPTLPPVHCTNYSICEIIRSKVFEKCHKLVPYEPFVMACNFDVCHINNVSIGCASLQTYAEECALAGVCIDWRGATNGTCRKWTEVAAYYTGAGTTWTNGCETCTCVPETLTLNCVGPACPAPQPVTCDQEGQVKITETVGCCQNLTCGEWCDSLGLYTAKTAKLCSFAKITAHLCQNNCDTVSQTSGSEFIAISCRNFLWGRF
uniref:VWFD domain-containing protein n=1 Tax=Pygocentrus nattereri TaxID=42514 RepID=A0A3B4ELD1_PYGNA